jgi:diguanylate cyclase (GGDEF)-like protein
MSNQLERDYPPRLRRLIICVFALAGPVVAGAVVSLSLSQVRLSVLVGASVLGSLAFLADLKPVPLDENRDRSVSLAFVFVLATAILYGWEIGVVVGAVSVTLSQVVEHRPIQRTLFNGGAYALAAFAASAPSLVIHSDEISPLLTTVWAFVGGGLFVLVNVGLVCLAVSFHSGLAFRALLVDNMRHAGAAFVTMASLAALAVVLWANEPLLLALLAGPLAALTLYQRSTLDWRIANRAAHTDSLTGLGNHRAFELDLEETISRSKDDGNEFTLCYVDVDLFKEINDSFGHPSGDACLEALSGMLSDEAAGVRAFRFGGDEFALIIERPLAEARAYVERLRDTVATSTFQDEVPVTISAGLAAFPAHAGSEEALQRLVDAALYEAKAEGRNGVRVHDPRRRSVRSVEEQQAAALMHSRLQVAESLIRLVDARDTYTGRHSHSVAVASAGIAAQLGLEPEVVEQVRLAGLLHDLGKILLADEVLQKPTALTEEETNLVRTHPELGASLLLGLHVDPVDEWVKHHHEHWDGSGYPYKLVGEAIPLGSRIILVADAFDAITSDRSYRAALTAEQAVSEIRAAAGRQFDPTVVAAFEAHLRLSADPLAHALQPIEPQQLSRLVA